VDGRFRPAPETVAVRHVSSRLGENMSVVHSSGPDFFTAPRFGQPPLAAPFELNLKPQAQALPAWRQDLTGGIDGEGAQLPFSAKHLVQQPSEGPYGPSQATLEPLAALSFLAMLAMLFSAGAGAMPPGAGQGPYGGQGGQSEKSGKPSASDKRPPGDNRTAEQIIEDNPVLKNLGNQKDINREGLKKQCGDWENDPDPQKRADAAFKVAKVLNYIDSSKNREGGEREGKVTNGLGDGNIEGITKDGDARHGTEAALVKDFSEQGYGALPDDHQLTSTNDSHVRLNGSNMDNFQWGCQQAAKYIGFLPIVGGFLKGVGDSEDGILNGLMGGFSGAASDVTKGRFTPWGLATGVVQGAIEQAVGSGKDRSRN
jgi:hypothetical protein